MARQTKIAKLQQLIQDEDWDQALALASRFPIPGWGGTKDDMRAVQLAHEANVRPDFYRQLKKDPLVLKLTGISVLVRLYGGC
jgi:hypothetical protein